MICFIFLKTTTIWKKTRFYRWAWFYFSISLSFYKFFEGWNESPPFFDSNEFKMYTVNILNMLYIHISLILLIWAVGLKMIHSKFVSWKFITFLLFSAAKITIACLRWVLSIEAALASFWTTLLNYTTNS
jgi:hypothetical protein